MTHPLDGCWAKVERANEHIKYLTAELQRILDGNTRVYGLTVERNPDTLEFVVKAFDDGMDAVPLRYSVIVGETIHQLRSCLDHLVWALVLRRHSNPSFKVSFPICETRKKFEAALSDGIVKGISARTLGAALPGKSSA